MAKKILFALIALMLASVVSAQHDQYGKWQFWETSLGTSHNFKYYYLKSNISNQGDEMNKPTTLFINKETGCIYLNLVLDFDASLSVIGKTEPPMNNPIVEIEMAFDNGEFGYFTFVELFRTSDHSANYSFIIFDRFKKTINYDATSMLKQMANKQTLKIRYKLKSGSIKTQTFSLEGLDAILEMLNK